MKTFLNISYRFIILLVFLLIGIIIGAWPSFNSVIHNEIIRVSIVSLIGAGIPAFIVWSLTEQRRFSDNKEKFLDLLQNQYATAYEVFVYMYSLLSHKDGAHAEIVKAPHLYEVRNLQGYDTETLLKLNSELKKAGKDFNLLISKITSDLYIKALKEYAIDYGEDITKLNESERAKLLEIVTFLFVLSGDIMTVIRDYLTKENEVYLPVMEKLVQWDLYHRLSQEKNTPASGK